jgi:hypothetical protein
MKGYSCSKIWKLLCVSTNWKMILGLLSPWLVKSKIANVDLIANWNIILGLCNPWKVYSCSKIWKLLCVSTNWNMILGLLSPWLVKSRRKSKIANVDLITNWNMILGLCSPWLFHSCRKILKLMCEQALKHDPGTLQSIIGEFVHHKQSNHCAFCYQQKHDPRTLQSMICEVYAVKYWSCNFFSFHKWLDNV